MPVESLKSKILLVFLVTLASCSDAVKEEYVEEPVYDFGGHVRVYEYDSYKTIADTNKNSSTYGPAGWNLIKEIDGEAAGIGVAACAAVEDTRLMQVTDRRRTAATTGGYGCSTRSGMALSTFSTSSISIRTGCGATTSTSY